MKESIYLEPLKVIKSLYDENPDILKNLEEIGNYFRVILNNDFTKIPSINEVSLDQIRPETLVCYRGMVQDMFDPEYYLGKYETLNKQSQEKIQRLGCYTDCNEKQDEIIDFDSPNNITMDRQTFYCVPVPGENQWLKQMYKSCSSYETSTDISSPNNKKRAYDDIADEAMEDDETESKTDSNMVENKSIKTDTQDSKEPSAESNATTKPKQKIDFARNFPFPEETGLPCLMKMYSEHNDLKINDVVECICILSVDPVFAAKTMNDTTPTEQDTMMGWCENNIIEDKAHCPPPSLVPRLHCLFYNKITHLNPSVRLKDSLYESVSKELSAVRSEILRLLSQLLGGDEVTAEYLLFYLISSVYGRLGTMCIGKMSLNLMKCPSGEYTSLLYDFIQSIVEKSYYLPLTLDRLNNTYFTPRKDYEANRLVSGQLQLPSGFHLVLDETKMQSGKLDSDGVRNLTAMGNVIQWQKLDYDFKFNKVEMDANVEKGTSQDVDVKNQNVLVFSEGKSMLTCDYKLPIVSENINEVNVKEILGGLSETLLERIRLYLGIIRSLEYNLTDEIQKALQEDFVEMRKEDTKVSADSFYTLLTTARYMAMSFGETTLTSQLWSRTKDLDVERRKRIS